jgi:hypothetical protein
MLREDAIEARSEPDSDETRQDGLISALGVGVGSYELMIGTELEGKLRS